MVIDLNNFFVEKSKDFYEGGILSLPGRWQRVIDSDGAYITKASFIVQIENYKENF